ncbi:hypothetical protein [uncultured Bifidobacterium sp.]|nr:hypothetical protein [uncultured Bifidobacterium sp.]
MRGYQPLESHRLRADGAGCAPGAIRRPITLANAYALPYDPSDIN